MFYNTNTPDTNCKSIFLIEKQIFSGFLKIIGAQNQLHITFYSDLMLKWDIKGWKFDPQTHEYLTFNIPIAH